MKCPFINLANNIKRKYFNHMIIMTASVILSPISSAATPKDCADYLPKYPNEYRACLKIEVTASAKDNSVDCKDCFLENDKNPWVEALSIISMPVSEAGAKYLGKYDYKKSQDAWKSAWEEAYNSPENVANREEFGKILEELSKDTKAPVGFYDLQKFATLVTDYKMLKSTLDPKDLPTFEEFRKIPDAFITRAGWHMYAHKKDPCIDYKQIKYQDEYTKCRSINGELLQRRVSSGIYGGALINHGDGTNGGGSIVTNGDVDFCTPNNNESECSTVDGRVYKLHKGTNQTGRGLTVDKREDATTQPKKASDAIKK